ncbi:CPSF A subunit region-domain-containing protein [Hyaloraphidium curvatum]|nr:CPSF A subunit region-domain-containing protein [Hyaloraphidium curvatum]
MEPADSLPLWQYVVTAQRPTSVGAALKCRLGASGRSHLVVRWAAMAQASRSVAFDADWNSKGTRLEVYSFEEQGLRLLLDTPVFGRISAMKSFKPKDRGELLLLLTERCKLCLLSWDSQAQSFVTEAVGDMTERGAAFAENGQIAVLDPGNQMLAFHLYQGMLQLVPVATEGTSRNRAAFFMQHESDKGKGKRSAGTRAGDLGEPFNLPLLAVLYQDVRENRHLRSYYVSAKDKTITDGPLRHSNLEAGASMLIPVPSPSRGILVIGEQSVTYLGDGKKPAISLSFRITIMTCWGSIDDGMGPPRFLLGDRYGNLFLLLLFNQGNEVTELKLEPLGTTSAPSCLVYLDNGHVFVGSHYGDSQLVRLLDEKDDSGELLETLDKYTNLAPILDFAVMDSDKQGQGQIVACCGGFKDGTLRIIRSGVGLNEIADFEMPGLKNVWSLRPHEASNYDELLVLSFVEGTQVLEITGGELNEVSIEGFDPSEPTLHCGNMTGDHFLQITAKGIRLVSASTRLVSDEWLPRQGTRITVATANKVQVLCALGDKTLELFAIEGGKLRHMGSHAFEQEISCLDIAAQPAERSPSELCAVGVWNTQEAVSIRRLPTFETVAVQKLDGDFIPRSVALTNFEGVHHLLVGQGDGRLYDVTLGGPAGSVVLYDKRVITLGTQPITLTRFLDSNGHENVFVGCDRPTVVHSQNRKMLYSQMNLKEALSMSGFSSEEVPNALAIVSEERLKIGTVDQIQKLHIRTVHLREMARRIAYQEQSRTFAILTLQTNRDDATGDEHESSCVRIVDDQTFEVLDSLGLQTNEQGLSIASYEFNVGEQDRPAATVFVVGTAFADPSEDEPQKGRIIVLEVVNKSLRVVAQAEVKGAVYSFAPLDGHFAAGINNKIYVYRPEIPADGPASLVQVCGHHGLVIALTMASRGPYLLVGDLMKSLSLLMFRSEQGKLELVARDADTNWITAAGMLNDDVFIGADNSFNLFTLRRNTDATRDEERRRLELVGEYHVGGNVNRFQKGSLVMTLAETSSVARPNLLFAMSDGSIGSILNISKEHYNTLESLQSSLAKSIHSAGSFGHASWRSFANEKRSNPAHHFIDGDLVEMFLELVPEQQEAVVEGMESQNVDVVEVRRLVEALSRAH